MSETDSSRKRLLVAAGSSVGDVAEVPYGVQVLIDEADEILVVSPALPNRLDWLASATDRAREAADERLGNILDQLEELGSEAEGRVGADDPLLAFEDALRDFSAGHLLIALRHGSKAAWQEPWTSCLTASVYRSRRSSSPRTNPCRAARAARSAPRDRRRRRR